MRILLIAAVFIAAMLFDMRPRSGPTGPVVRRGVDGLG